MKHFLLIAALSLTTSVVFGQFAGYNTTHTKLTNYQGNVLLGNTLNPTVSPLDKLEVLGNIRATSTSPAGTGNILFNGGVLEMNSTTRDFKLRVNVTDRLTILNANGNV